MYLRCARSYHEVRKILPIGELMEHRVQKRQTLEQIRRKRRLGHSNGPIPRSDITIRLTVLLWQF